MMMMMMMDDDRIDRRDMETPEKQPFHAYRCSVVGFILIICFSTTIIVENPPLVEQDEMEINFNFLMKRFPPPRDNEVLLLCHWRWSLARSEKL